MPTINQETAIAGPEPNETLTKYRSDKVLRPDKKQQGKVRSLRRKFGTIFCCNGLSPANDPFFKYVLMILQIFFGQNMVCKESLSGGKAKMVKVGDPIFVLQKVSTVAEAVA